MHTSQILMLFCFLGGIFRLLRGYVLPLGWTLYLQFWDETLYFYEKIYAFFKKSGVCMQHQAGAKFQGLIQTLSCRNLGGTPNHQLKTRISLRICRYQYNYLAPNTHHHPHTPTPFRLKIPKLSMWPKVYLLYTRFCKT